MQYTQAQIDRANAVSLEDFLRTQGETLIKINRIAALALAVAKPFVSPDGQAVMGAFRPKTVESSFLRI